MKISITDELIQRITQISGLRVTEFDHEKLLAWLKKRLNVLGLESSADYFHYLDNTADLSQDREMLSELLTTGETFFMRDNAQMELIKRTILPDLITKNQQKKQLRIWAPACATGEELYSLIIVLDQVLPNQSGWKVDIIGSDINPNFIDKAKIASYKEWSFRGCSPEFKNAYFTKDDEGWHLIDRIQRRARFIVLDLVSATLPDFANQLFDIDFILCRNIFIYMNFESINLITDKLSACLAPGGVLMTAHGELHAYRKSGLFTKLYPESLVYEKQIESFGEIPRETPNPSYQPIVAKSKVSSFISKKSPEPILIRQSTQDLLKRAWYLADRGQFDEALSIYRLLISQDSMQTELHYLHAIISMETGDLDKAKDDLRKSLYLDPTFIPAYLELITIYIQDGKTGMALKYCKQAIRALQETPTAEVRLSQQVTSAAEMRGYLMNLQNKLTSQT